MSTRCLPAPCAGSFAHKCCASAEGLPGASRRSVPCIRPAPSRRRACPRGPRSVLPQCAVDFQHPDPGISGNSRNPLPSRWQLHPDRFPKTLDLELTEAALLRLRRLSVSSGRSERDLASDLLSQLVTAAPLPPIPAALSLALFAWLLPLHPTAAGRVQPACGAVDGAVALAWLRVVDGALEALPCGRLLNRSLGERLTACISPAGSRCARGQPVRRRGSGWHWEWLGGVAINPVIGVIFNSHSANAV